ncbi:MAG: hypothetical protein ABIV28_05075 [Longimicrobiales bacterium]
MKTQGCFTWRRPDAGAIVWAKYTLPIPSLELAERLRAEHSVLIVPGMQFGVENFIRFGIGGLPDSLMTALDRTQELIRTLE